MRLPQPLLRWKTIAALRWAAGFYGDCVAAPNSAAVHAMGLTFANPVGLAAGFDRTGSLLGPLSRLGFGHVELGMVTPASRPLPPRPAARVLRVGVNFGSRRPGLDGAVIEAYCAAFRAAHAKTDYLAANLSSPFLGRHADTPGVERLLACLKQTQDDCAANAPRVPLLLKLRPNGDGSRIPRAVAEARNLGFEGLILVSSSPGDIEAIRDYFPSAVLISVGGVQGGRDVSARIAAGANLVQILTAFLRNGPRSVPRLLEELASGGG